MQFKGKVDRWFYAVLLGSAALLLPLIYLSGFADPNPAALALVLLVFAAVEGFGVSVLLRNVVKLQNSALRIEFGFLKKQIAYDKITVTATRDPGSSLAASLDRIGIRCSDGSDVMISVKEKDSFVAELKKRREAAAS